MRQRSAPILRLLFSLLLFTLILECVAKSDELFESSTQDEFRIQRSSLANSLLTFKNSKNARVAFMGGSITEMDGYRPMVTKWLQEKFPSTQFEFINAGIASTCSTTGAFRLDHDVLSKGPIDLFIVEFAVNDNQDAFHSPRGALLGMEGLIRHLRTAQPNCDVVMVHFCNESILADLNNQKLPVSIEQHERVAQHYNVSSALLAHQVAQLMKEEKVTWNKYGGVHPAPYGNSIAAKLVEDLLQESWDEVDLSKAKAPTPYSLPKPLDQFCFSSAKFSDKSAIPLADGWTLETPDWSKLAGECRTRFRTEKLFCSNSPGKSLTFTFEGTALSAYVLAGPDAGQLEVRIDGGDWQTTDLYHAYSGGLHYPRTVVIASDLERRQHQVEIRVHPKSNERSKGTAARILEFGINP